VGKTKIFTIDVWIPFRFLFLPSLSDLQPLGSTHDGAPMTKPHSSAASVTLHMGNQKGVAVASHSQLLSEWTTEAE